MTDTPSTTSYVANVWDDDDEPIFMDWMENAPPEPNTITRDGLTFFNPYLPLHDRYDPDDGPLYLMYAYEKGTGGAVYAPMCFAPEEIERRIIRCLGDTVSMDSLEQAVWIEPGQTKPVRLPEERPEKEDEYSPEVRFLATRVVFTAQHKTSDGRWVTIARGDIDYSGCISLGGDENKRALYEDWLEQYDMAQRHTFGPQGGEESEIFAESAFLAHFTQALKALPQGWQPWVSPDRSNS